MTFIRRTGVVAAAAAMLLLAGCGGETPKTNDTGTDSLAVAAAAQWATKRAVADSIIKIAPQMPEVIKQLGASRYDEADATLTAAVLKESEKTRDCYTNAVRDLDPNLSVVLYVLTNFGAAGWDLMRVEKWTQSSAAGGAVISCINYRAKTEWKLPTKGVKAGAHLTKLVYTPDSLKK